MRQVGLFVDVSKAVTTPARVIAPVEAFLPDEQRPWRTPIRDWFIVLKRANGEKHYRNFRGTYQRCLDARDGYLHGDGDYHSAWIIDETDKRRVVK